MAAGTVVSRLTGFGRAAVIAAAIGLGVTADTFNIPNVIPNMLYILVGGGILNSILVPALVRAIKNDEDGGEAYSQRLYSLAVAALGAATALSVLAAPLVIKAIVNPIYLEPERAEFLSNMVMFARFCLPQIFFYGLYVLIGQILNAKGRFGPMMWSPILNNVIAIAVFGAYLLWFGTKDSAETYSSTEVMLLGVGSTVAVAAQALILLPVLRQTGFSLRFRTDWRGHGLGEAVRLGMWTFGFVAVNQLAYLIVVKVASGGSVIGDAPGSGYSVYANAMLIMMVPHSVITVSLATALLPRLSDLASDEDYGAVRERLTMALRTCLAVIIPFAALVAALAYPLVALIFSHGAATGQTSSLALTLILLMPGLIGFTLHYLVLRGFYAFQDTKTPFFTQIWVSSVMIIGAIVIAVLSPDRAHVTALLAGGYSAAYVVGSTVGLLRLQRRIGSLESVELVRHIIRVAVPAALAAGLTWLISRGWSELGFDGFIGNALNLALAGTIGLAAFVGLAYAFRIDEVRAAVSMVIGRFTDRGAEEVQAPTEIDRGALLDDTAEHRLPAETGSMAALRRAFDPELTSEYVLDETMHGLTGLWDTTSAVQETRSHHLSIDTQPELPVIPPTPTAAPSAPLTPGPGGRPPIGRPQSHSLAQQQADSQSQPQVRSIIGRYQMDRLLVDDDGSQAWQAVDEILQRPVHVHTLPVHDSRAEEFAAAARAAATVADPRFLRVLDVGSDGVVYVVREWIPGHSLETLLTNGPLAPDQAAAITREVADAVAVAHAQGLSHCRLDPSCVFVTTDGSVKIAGLETDAALYGPRSASENPARPVTDPVLVDTAGIGGVLYAALTGRWPWEPIGQLPAAPRVDGRVPSPRQVRPGVPRDLNVVADRALGQSARHHAAPLLTAGAVSSELINTPFGHAHVGGYDGPEMRSYAPSPAESAEPPRLETRHVPPPLPGGERRKSSNGLLRTVGVIGAALLLIGAALFGLQLLLREFDSPTDDDRDDVPTQPQGENQTSSQQLEPLTIVNAEEFDPFGSDQHPEDAGRVYDGDPGTTWETKDYYSPMEDQKDGLGVYLDMGETVDIQGVNVELFGEDSDLELLVAPEDASDAPDGDDDFDEWVPVDRIEGADSSADFKLDEPVSSRYVLVWLTRLPPNEGGDEFRGGIAEAEVLG